MARVEDVLDVHHLPYDEERPPVCLGEASKQLAGGAIEPISAGPVRAVRIRVHPPRHGRPVHDLRTAAGLAGRPRH